MKIYVVNSYFPTTIIAKKIANGALKNRFAACANIKNNINSYYWWSKKILNSKEIEVSFKTSKNKLVKLINFIEKNHPYDCPAIISYELFNCNQKYKSWVLNETK